MKSWQATLLAAMALPFSAANADAPCADEILRQTGITRGVACVPRCGGGTLALELARRSKLLVLAMDADPGSVAAARRKASEAGLLGRQLYVEQRPADGIPFADHYVDLVLLPDVTARDLPAAVPAETLSVLTPGRGQADFLSKRQPLIRYPGWKLTALNRADGTAMWSVKLPSEPLFNGLAVSADGTVAVTLRDGTVLAVR